MEPLNWSRILAPTDLSSLATKAVNYAHSLAEKVNAELHVLHVVKDVTELAREHGATGLLEPGAGSDEYDDWLANLLGESGKIRRVESMRVNSDASEAILEYAKKHDIELIVMATHGHSGLRHIFLGSVCEKVMRGAPCPMLVIRP